MHPRQGIKDITGAGFENIELNMAFFCSPGELENIGVKEKKPKMDNRIKVSEHPEELYNRMKALLDDYKKAGLCTPVAYAPYLPRDTKHGTAFRNPESGSPAGETTCEQLHTLLTRLTEESIKACGAAGCKYLVVRPLTAGVPASDEWARNKAYYLGLAELAREYQVQILLENQCRSSNGHLVRGICSDAQEAADWIDALNQEAGEECFGFCMDVGVCNLCGQNMYDFALSLGHRLKAVVLRDCDGDKENALLPFTCVNGGQPQTDWLNLIRGLREICFDGLLVMDFGSTAAAFSPILRPGLVKLAKSVAEYFKWQIEIESLLEKYPERVLFGAGNMCRNYMKCYGEKYPPLYTCDNNRELWGTSFCGLTVKDPASLKELPEKCVIFICNIYYREIEEQLRKMGVTNPIEFFNDEYMPSFYFDRLESRWPGSTEVRDGSGSGGRSVGTVRE